MNCKITSFFTHAFFFVFFSFLAVHYTYMKAPSQYREIASFEASPQPWYDASFKY